MTTCKETVFATPLSSGDGVPTKSRPTARTLSLRSFPRKSWPRSSRVAAREWPPRLSGRSKVRCAFAIKTPLDRIRLFAFRFSLPAPLAPFARRIIVGIGSLLRRPKFLGDMLQIDADPGPCGRPATHRVDQHILGSQQFHNISVFRLPALQTSHSSRLIRRICDHNEWHLDSWLLRRRFCARGSNPGRLRIHFAKMGRPGRIRETGSFVFVCEFKQLLKRTCCSIHVRVRITNLCESLGHGEDSEVGGIAIGNFAPIKRRRYPRIRKRPYGIRGAGSSVLRILVVIEEDSVPLFLPPFRCGQGWHALFYGTRQRHRRAPHFLKCPSRLDANIHVHAARPAGLGPASGPKFLEQVLRFERNLPHVVPADAGNRIEIDSQLIRMIKIARANRMRMELDATEVHDPGETSNVADHYFFRSSPGRK